jgi:hypothetical protein
MCVSRMGEVGQMSFFLLGTVEEEEGSTLIPCSPARPVSVGLTGEESLGRCLGSQERLRGLVTARAFVSACAWIWGLTEELSWTRP